MPNHVQNQLYIIAPNKKLETEILDFLKEESSPEEEGHIDFNKITPTPPWIHSGNLGTKEKGIWGKHNWYDWNNENWGTKWNAYSQFSGMTEIGSDSIPIIDFQTAWSPPVEVLSKLPYIFPYAAFFHLWADEDHGFNVGAALYALDEDKVQIIRSFSDSPMGDSLASYVWGETIESALEFLDDGEDGDINEQVKRYDPLMASILVEESLLSIISNKVLYLPEDLRPDYDFINWKMLEGKNKEEIVIFQEK